MARLIDDDKVKMQLTMVMSMHMPLNTKYMIVPIDNFVQNIIQNATVGEVVRCKDCKFFDHSDFGKGEEYWCKHFVSTDDTAHCHKVCEDDFCAWGERREDE